MSAEDGQQLVQQTEGLTDIILNMKKDKWLEDARRTAREPDPAINAVYDTLSNSKTQQYAFGVKHAAQLAAAAYKSASAIKKYPGFAGFVKQEPQLGELVEGAIEAAYMASAANNTCLVQFAAAEACGSKGKIGWTSGTNYVKGRMPLVLTGAISPEEALVLDKDALAVAKNDGEGPAGQARAAAREAIGAAGAASEGAGQQGLNDLFQALTAYNRQQQQQEERRFNSRGRGYSPPGRERDAYQERDSRGPYRRRSRSRDRGSRDRSPRRGWNGQGGGFKGHFGSGHDGKSGYRRY